MMKIHFPEKFRTKPDCVLFDLDNTLYPYDPAHEAALGVVKLKVTKNFSLDEKTFDHAFEEAKKQRIEDDSSPDTITLEELYKEENRIDDEIDLILNRKLF